MIRNILSHIGGIEIYGVVSVLLFFSFFVGMLVWTICLNSAHLEAMREIPLSDVESLPDGESWNGSAPSNASSLSPHEF